MIPTDGVRKLYGEVDSVPPDDGCEVLNGELTPEYWDKNDSKNFSDSDSGHIFARMGGHYRML